MKIAIAHFRIGLTDGVSLQIDERVRILRDLGHEVVFIAGSNSPIADLRIPYFEYKTNPVVLRLQQKIFNKSTIIDRSVPIWYSVKEENERVAVEIEKSIGDFWQKEKFSHIFIHNIFCLPVCLPATTGLYNFLKKKSQIKGVAFHHDFWWDPPRKNKFKVQNSKFKVFLNNYFPPKLSNLTHTVISKWEQAELKKRKDLNSEVIWDTYDFAMEPWKRDKSNRDFLDDIRVNENDLKILCASRVRRRKGIEMAIEFANALRRQIQKSQFPNHKHPNKYQKITLILPGEFGEKETKYINLLKQKAKEVGVDVRWIQKWVGSEDEKDRGLKKYSLWDTYVYADIVIYPSLWEGFGNQLLEAVFAKKPVVVFEYPVFKSDIKPLGFKVISLGDKVKFDSIGLAEIEDKFLNKAAEKLLSLLQDKKMYNNFAKENFEIGKKFFDTKAQLKNQLKKLLKIEYVSQA